MEKYIITRVLNNNVAIVKIKGGSEVIVLGNGIGFNRKPGSVILSSEVEKMFIDQKENMYKKLFETVSSVSSEYLDIVDYTVELAKSDLSVDLSEQIYVLLTDHLLFSVQRAKEKVDLPCPMLNHLKVLYKDEVKVAGKVVRYIESKFDIKMFDSEVGFIALHIMNAKMIVPNMNQVLDLMSVVGLIVDKIEQHFECSLNQDSIDYMRLMVHLEFFAKRIVSEVVDTSESTISLQFDNKYDEVKACVKEIKDLLTKNFKYTLTQNDMSYLMIHIYRNIH